jgi:hypothetical protein
LFSFFSIETFDIQITSLFWGLVLKAFVFNNLLTLLLLLSGDDI